MDVRVCVQLRSPATFASTILLPEEFAAWNAQKRDTVIAHERSHVREGDWYVLSLAQLNACLFWFNPMAWWLRRRLAALAEATADEAALSVLGDRPGYAHILLEFAGFTQVNGSAMSMSQSNVSDRIERILSETGPFQVSRPPQRLLAFSAILPAALVLAGLQVAHSQAARAETPVANSNTEASTRGPHIVSYGGLARLAQYYPDEARRNGIEGFVELAVTLDNQGRATDTLILSEVPAGQGFGAAASAAAHTMVYVNPTGQPVQFTFRVTFALQHSREGVMTEEVQPAK
jgi:TonB family protein